MISQLFRCKFMIGRTKGILLIGIFFLVLGFIDTILGIVWLFPSPTTPGLNNGAEFISFLSKLPYIGSVYLYVYVNIYSYIPTICILLIVFGILSILGGTGFVRMKRWGYDLINLLLIVLMLIGLGIVMAAFFVMYDAIFYGDWKWITAIVLHPATYITISSYYIGKYTNKFHINIAYGMFFITPHRKWYKDFISRIKNLWRKKEDLNKAYEDAFNEYQLNGNKILFIDKIIEIGNKYIEKRNYNDGLKHYQEALLLTEDMENEEVLKLKIKSLIGRTYKIKGESYNSLKTYEDALNLAESMNSEYINDIKANILMEMGTIYESFGKFYDAYEYYSNSLEIAKLINDLYRIKDLLGYIGGLYLKWGKPDETLNYLKQQLRICEQLNQRKEADKLVSIIYRMEKKYDETIRVLEHLYYQIASNRDYVEMAKLLIEFGKSYLRMNKLDLSGLFFYQAYLIFKKSDIRYNMGECLNYLSDVALKKGKYEDVIFYSSNAIEIFEEFYDYANIGHSYNNMASALKAKKQFQEAFYNYNQAIDILENLIAGTRSEELRKSFRAAQLRPYHETIELLLDWYKKDLDPQHLTDALRYLELSKAREILDKLETTKLNIYSCPELQDLVEKEQELIEKIIKLEDELEDTRTRGVIRKSSLQTLDSMRDELKQLRTTLMEKCKDPGLIRAPSEYNPIYDYEEIFKQENFIVWEFIYLPESPNFKNKFIILTWDRESIQIFQSNKFDKNELLNLLQEFYETLSYITLIILKKKLHALFPTPLFETLENKSKLVLIPHDLFHLFPWEIIDDLGLKIPIVRSYSLGLLRSCMKREKEMSNALLISNPNFNIPSMNLSGAELEVNSLLALFEKHNINYELLLRENANEKSFVEKIKNPFAIIHFAGHGVFDAKDPWMSGLLFYTPENYDIRTITELVTQKFNGTPLFVLSACETGRSTFSKGDELIGLIRGLTLAGCTSIIATNWPLDDSVAPYFMKSFYSYYLQGLDVCESLFKARLDIIKMATGTKRAFKHPLYWAVYTLYGNPLKKLNIK